MRHVLLTLILGGGLLCGGCANREQKPEYRESLLSDLPFVYKMTVQQGNLVTEEMIDRLEPGMTRNQVRYLLGTPMLVDLFHTDRWYYTYTIRRGHDPMEKRPLAVYFDGDALTRVEGYLQPDPERAANRAPKELFVSVPDWKDHRGLFRKALGLVGFQGD